MTPTERQMIEDAARAIGLSLEWDGNPAQWQPMYYEGKTYHRFDPLTNSADTYMLMERLGMFIFFGRKWCYVYDLESIKWPDDEPDAAHAITRCAAEVWRMKK